MTSADAGLTAIEQNLLMRMAYLDLPPNTGQLTVRELLSKWGSYGGNDRQASAIAAIRQSVDEPNSHLGDLRLTDYQNNNGANNDGFVGYAFTDSSGNRLFSFRGTEEMSRGLGAIDNRDNLSSSLAGDSDQVQSALDFFSKNASTYPRSNFLFGHSKAGNLASEVYVANADLVGGVHVINAQPINWWTLTEDQREALRDPRYDFAATDGDFVHLIGYLGYKVRHLKTDSAYIARPGNGLINAHDLESATYDPATGQAIENPESVFDAIYLAGGVLLLGTLLLSPIATAAAILVGALLVTIAVEYVATLIADGLEKTFAFVDAAAEYLAQMPGMVAEVVAALRQDLRNLAESILDKLGSLFGFAGSSAHFGPVVVSPEKLKAIAQRLRTAQRIVDDVDGRLDRLLWASPVENALSVMSIDFSVGHDRQLTRCADYLEQAARRFELGESNIRAQALQFGS